MKKKIYIDSSRLPRYEKGNSESYEKRNRAYQKAYQKSYRKTVKDIRIRLSEEEYDRLKEQADSDGIPLTRYIMDHFYAMEK